MSTAPRDKLAALRHALEEYESGAGGGELFDHEKDAAMAKVRNRALLLLDHRARSRHELKTRLLALDFDPEIVADVIADLIRLGLVDDESFAKEWVRQRHAARGKSRWVLDRELQQKGIGAEERAAALSQVSEESEEEQARVLAFKKARSIKAVPADRGDFDKQLRRVVGVLARRGYSQAASLRIAREALEERISRLEED
ncbi:recombination regulator RecX [Corynebacterium flavescens]